MRVIKNINNNVSLCLDSNGNEVVAFGKGIGFTKPSYEIDLSVVEKTYYNLKKSYISMINDLSAEVLDIADQVVNYAVIKLDSTLNSNIVFTLADHIDFAIKRYKQNINFELPITHDVEHLFEQEVEIGNYALRLIYQKLGVQLPKGEAAYIALNIINSEFNFRKKKNNINEEIINNITKIIEECFAIKIDRTSFSYSRFVTHMYYLLKRKDKDEQIKSENKYLYDQLIKAYPKTYNCVIAINKYLKEQNNWVLAEEECLYLILHINRLCAREDCYQ